MAELVRIRAPHYCAGLGTEGGTCTWAAPILRWAVGKSWSYLRSYFERKGFEVVVMPMPESVALPLTVLVTGSRKADATLIRLVWDCLDALAPTFVILGDCPGGVDNAAWSWCFAKLRPDQYRCHEADWTRYNSAAGPKRNGAMVAHAIDRRAIGQEVLVLAFPRGGPGTADCMAQARAAGLAVEEM